MVNLIPILQKSKILQMNFDNLGDLKLEDTNNQTISKIANESEKLLSEKTLGIVRDENWFKWRVLDYPERKKFLFLVIKTQILLQRLKLKITLKF